MVGSSSVRSQLPSGPIADRRGPPLEAVSAHPGFPYLIARSTAFRAALDALDRFARFDRALVLLEGEAGTGKTSLARYLHEASPRRQRTFHRVDLGALDDALSSSELFGHAPGAFTGAFTGASARRHGHFASAERGTLLLDEIGKASLTVQRRLLHVIEYGELTAVGTDRPFKVDVRLVAATNVSLERLVECGEFLPDLLPRFGFFRITVPPLRERRADIAQLAANVVHEQAGAFGYPPQAPPRLHPELVAAFEHAPWPGNVRELVSAVQLLLVLADGAPELTPDHCAGPLAHLAVSETPAARARRTIAETGSVVAAARKLGVRRSTLYRHLGPEGQGRGTPAPSSAPACQRHREQPLCGEAVVRVACDSSATPELSHATPERLAAARTLAANSL